MVRKPPGPIGSFIAVVCLFMLALALAGQLGKNNQSVTRSPQGVLGPESTVRSQTTITVNGSTYEPTYSTLGTISDNTQWQLVDRWDDYVIENGVPVDWGFFCEVATGCTRLIVAKCVNWDWTIPEIGTIYTGFANGSLVPPADPPGLQNFEAMNEVINPFTPNPTQTLLVSPTASLAPNQGVLPATPIFTPIVNRVGSQWTISYGLCLRILGIAFLVIVVLILILRFKSK